MIITETYKELNRQLHETNPHYGVSGAKWREFARALMKCDPRKIHFVFATKSPCTACTLMLLNTEAKSIVFDTPSNETQNRDLWIAAGREWIRVVQRAAA